MELKKGYKQTEVGIVPEDWETSSIGHITKFHKQGYYTKEKYKTDGKYYLLRGTDMLNTTIDLSSTPKIDATCRDYDAYKVEVNDFLIVRSGAIGRYGIVKPNFPKAIFGSYLIIFRFDNEKVWTPYLGHYYQSYFCIKQLESITQGGGNININAENIKSLFIALPSFHEQTAIAAVLSDADLLIQSLEKLIEKKRAIKHGAMQDLLKPKKGWTMRRLGDHCELITKGTTPSFFGKSFGVGDVQFIKIESLSSEGKIISDRVSFINSETNDLLKRSQLKTGDLLFSIAGALGRVAKVEDKILPANTNQALAIVRLRKDSLISSEFLYYFLKSSRIQKHILDVSVQGAQANLSLTDISELSICYPLLEEQTMTVSILLNLDLELATLEQKLAKYKLVKQGMMQELLTGKTRII